MNTDHKDPVHPYYRAILDAYASMGRSGYHEVTPIEAREMLRSSLAAAPPQADLAELASVNDESVAGGIWVRRYRPHGETRGACVYLHAGGWVIGDLETGDALCRRLAHAAGCEILSVDYRLAPEDPHPAALDDAYAVLEWADGELLGPLVLVGESAGGNLAAACTIRAQRERGPTVVGQLLAYPVTDHDFSTESYRQVGRLNYLLSEADMRWFWDQYCPPSVSRDDPLVSPLRVSEARGLPPAMICVAELDPLRDEGLAYADLLRKAGVSVQTRCDAGMLHGYLSAAAAVPAAAEAVAEGAAWIRSRIRESVS